MNNIITYFYNGANAVDITSTSVVVNATTYWTLVAEVAIFYGNYQGADTVEAIQPINLPPLTNVEFNANFYRVGGAKYSTAKLINVTPVFETADMRNCLGTKFTFVSPIVSPDDCVHDYELVWSTNGIKMPYGANMIYVDAQSGVSASESLC